MSWSVNLIGTPSGIESALAEEGAKLGGQSQIEFEAARPHLAALVLENFSHGDGPQPVLFLAASGSGYSRDGEQVNRSCTVKLEVFYARLV